MMKYRAILAATAILSTTIMSTPAFATVTILDSVTPNDADSTTLAAMQTQCDALAAAHGTAWHGTVDPDSITANPTPVSGPTEVGSHSIADAIEGTLEGAGTFTPAHTEIEGDPYRIGGSVNMFGDAVAVGGHYSASTYDFEGSFDTTFAYSFNCNMTETVHVPVQGYYEVADDGHGADPEAIRHNCDAFTALGPTWPNWGQDQAQCHFVVTAAAHDEDQDRPDEAGTPVNQTQNDTLLAHENNGEGFDTSETLNLGQVVVCISPKKLPGTWTAKNGYTGNKCTTAWYSGTSPYSLSNYAGTNTSNLNTNSHNWVTVPTT